MSKVEQYIKDYTKHCSNEIENNEHQPWLTPDNALSAAEIAKEEILKEASDWLWYNIYEYIDDLNLKEKLMDDNYRAYLVDAFNQKFKIKQ